jgi:hypothetical protein
MAQNSIRLDTAQDAFEERPREEPAFVAETVHARRDR